MTYREFIDTLRSKWIGCQVEYNNNIYKVLGVDYNGMLLIDLPTPFTDTAAVEPFMVKLV